MCKIRKKGTIFEKKAPKKAPIEKYVTFRWVPFLEPFWVPFLEPFWVPFFPVN